MAGIMGGGMAASWSDGDDTPAIPVIDADVGHPTVHPT
jgi:hypothetical protein